ncbi:uncharacterized protein LOC117304480 isoform X1 [Asterias rubens]|uniref:uncharacterized protein LOC117304480 isoform X1 n=1 Tax=Asterias rubens TaxID=7604 RepID=UPI0014559759|nr:uncharacterized protein LOC117304480 isoform X1 [Asterias rubens]
MSTIRRENSDTETVTTDRGQNGLPDSTLQIAKVSKVLMKMEKGDLRGLAGKSLADVEVDPNEEYNTDAESDQSESEGTDDHDDLLPSKVRKGKGADAARTRNVPAIKKPWSYKEKAAVADHLGFFIRARTVPTKAPIVALLKREPEAFAARTWRNVKDFVRNQTRKVDPMGFMKH